MLALEADENFKNDIVNERSVNLSFRAQRRTKPALPPGGSGFVVLGEIIRLEKKVFVHVHEWFG